MEKPELDLRVISKESQKILQPIFDSFPIGDEAVFSSILNLFHQTGLEVLTLQEVIPKLFPHTEFLTKKTPNQDDIDDSIRAEEILTIISPADLGQSLIIQNRSCLAVETVSGTDKMLHFVMNLRKEQSKGQTGGILYKAPKNNQNSFLDIPVIGENTVKEAKKAGLNGIVIKQSKVAVLNPENTIELANKLGIFLWSRK